MEIILYENEDATICIIVPVVNAHGIDAVAKKDVPAGSPYWIVDDSALPQTREYRDAWRIDRAVMGEPHGYGHTASTFEGVLDDNA